jgi:hypothetical protein
MPCPLGCGKHLTYNDLKDHLKPDIVEPFLKGF